MKRILMRSLAVGVVLLLTLGGVAWAGSSGHARRPSANRANPQPLSSTTRDTARAALGAALNRQISLVRWSRNCRTLKCINTRLNTLKKAVNNAQRDVNALNNCMDVQGMTSFGDNPNGGAFGYDWQDTITPDEFLTTALDYDTLDLADIWALVWVC